MKFPKKKKILCRMIFLVYLTRRQAINELSKYIAYYLGQSSGLIILIKNLNPIVPSKETSI